MESGFIVEAVDDSWFRLAGSGALAVASELPVALFAGVSMLREEWIASYGRGPFEKAPFRGAERSVRNGSARLNVSTRGNVSQALDHGQNRTFSVSGSWPGDMYRGLR